MPLHVKSETHKDLKDLPQRLSPNQNAVMRMFGDSYNDVVPTEVIVRSYGTTLNSLMAGLPKSRNFLEPCRGGVRVTKLGKMFMLDWDGRSPFSESKLNGKPLYFTATIQKYIEAYSGVEFNPARIDASKVPTSRVRPIRAHGATA